MDRYVYVPHIDGLRAMAVLAVLLYHAFPTPYFAGFIGVDIFFVISGYLISRHIVVELERGKFKLSNFFARRVKRLLPSLIIVLSFVLVIGWIFVAAVQFENLGVHVLASLAYVQNFNLAFESGYFDIAAQKKPLLHIWSLSIEEQFYIIWPFVLIVLHARVSQLQMTHGIVLIMIASFILFVTNGNLDSRFYFPQYRFWELMFGASFVFISRIWPISSKIAAYAGALLIALGYVLIDKSSFPSPLIILPVLGCAILIVQTENNPIRAILSSRLATFIGKISYPLYLWHWPLLVFAYILIGETPSASIVLIILALSFILAWITYKFVEMPLRYHTRNAVLKLLIAMTLVGIAAITVVLFNGYESRIANQLVERYKGDIGHDVFHSEVDKSFVICRDNVLQKNALYWKNHIRCHQTRVGEIEIVLLGDSHAEHLYLGFAERSDKNVGYYINGGLPTISNPEFGYIYSAISEDESISTVVFSAYWEMYLDTHMSNKYKVKDLRKAIIDSIKHLTRLGKQVYFVNGLPSFDFDPEKCKYGTKFGGSRCNMLRDRRDDSIIEFLTNIKIELAMISSAHYINTFDVLCDHLTCSMVTDNKILFRDRNHLNVNGSRYIAEKLVKTITP